MKKGPIAAAFFALATLQACGTIPTVRTYARPEDVPATPDTADIPVCGVGWKQEDGGTQSCRLPMSLDQYRPYTPRR